MDGEEERWTRHTGESRYPVFWYALRALDSGLRRN